MTFDDGRRNSFAELLPLPLFLIWCRHANQSLSRFLVKHMMYLMSLILGLLDCRFKQLEAGRPVIDRRLTTTIIPFFEIIAIRLESVGEISRVPRRYPWMWTLFGRLLDRYLGTGRPTCMALSRVVGDVLLIMKADCEGNITIPTSLGVKYILSQELAPSKGERTSIKKLKLSPFWVTGRAPRSVKRVSDANQDVLMLLMESH